METSRRTFLAASAALASLPIPAFADDAAPQPPAGALGMYVHTHWAYNRPYAARSWTEADWHGYLSGLARLGFDTVMFWPLLDCMPADPTRSDVQFLEKIGRVIDHARRTHGMRFLVVACPNTVGNRKAADYPYEWRPYFTCERKIDPADPAAVKAFLAARREQFAPLAGADGLVIIDSDPGGFPGSTDEQFVSLCEGQLGVFRELNPKARFDYWMLIGWENYNRFWSQTRDAKPGEAAPALSMQTPTFVGALEGMRRRLAEPWSVLASYPPHLEATDRLKLGAKRMFFPYGVIEGEPSFPLTNFDPAAVSAGLAGYTPARYPRGLMANAQAHCLQLPHTYLFARRDKPDLAAFADELLPGEGGAVIAGWEAIGRGDAATRRETAAALRQRIGRPHRAGPCAGFLFGDADRFLLDLADNLDVRADLADVEAATTAGRDLRPSLRAFLGHFRPYQKRVGFNDAYGGPLDSALNVPLARLGDARLSRVLARFGEWRDLPARHGVVEPLLDAIGAYCDKTPPDAKGAG